MNGPMDQWTDGRGGEENIRPQKMWAYIVVAPASVRPSVRSSVRWSVNNGLYRLHFLMDFFHFWGVG